MTEISNTGIFKTGTLESVKFCQHIKCLLKSHEAKPQPSTVWQHTCKNEGDTFNKLSIKMKVQVMQARILRKNTKSSKEKVRSGNNYFHPFF